MKKLVLLAVLIGLVSSATGCIVPLYDGPGRGWHHRHGGWGERDGGGGGWGGGRHRHHDDD